MRLASWLAVSAVVAGGVVFASFTGCGGSSNSITSPQGDGGGSDATSTDSGTMDATKAMCGDGVVEAPEQCDDGAKNGTAGDPCTSDCNWVCSSDGGTSCNNSDPCTGAATCTANHTCMTGTPPPDGTACGTGMICRNNACSPAVCGDGFVTPPEECDDGSKNGTAGDGCTSNCMFVCVANIPSRDCVPTNPCAGQGTCNSTTHVCTAGTPEANGTACGMGVDGGVADAAAGSICNGGMCVSPQCGDGIVEPPEQCDFGAGNGPGTGCEANCTFSCTLSPNSCTTPDLCAGTNTCTAFTMGASPGQKCEVGTPPPNGTTCMNGGMCMGGVCKTALCGNGVLNTGEQCDWGTANNVAGSGCNPDCTFSCTLAPNDSCPGSAACSASPEKCTVVTGPTGTPAGDNGQKCETGTLLAACAACGGGDICVGNVCKAHVCGDGCVVPPETCDPPNGTTCGPTCQKIVCGDGVQQGNEQCDDGNTTNLDGCDSNCNFEQEQRATTLTINGSTDTYCTANALGAQALTGLGRGQIQNSVTADVATGAISVMFQFLGSAPPAPADLSGTTGSVVLGSLLGSPEDGDAGAYSGTSDLDWWYLVSPASINPSTRLPLSTLAGTYTAKELSAGPGSLDIGLILSGSPANLQLWNAKLKAAIGATKALTVSTGLPPGHAAAEHDEAALMTAPGISFASTTAGELCGDITAGSLQGVAVPASIAKGGSTACSQGYVVGTNSLLDVLIGGCTVLLSAVNPTQPDQQNPAVTFPTGTVPQYKLSASGAAGAKVVDTCKDSKGTVVTLSTCLAGLGYSSAFDFATDRVFVK
jgi:cysteine-rich repeat protein